MSWKFTNESSVTFQSSVSGPGEFSLSVLLRFLLLTMLMNLLNYKLTMNKNYFLLKIEEKIDRAKEEKLVIYDLIGNKISIESFL